ncbi:Hsp70 family protein [Rhizomonospora bruguierae]|uniref:Hsp70 family protein n=1 Tax=Rhizomonospora bruguierae TaxID=1581705 RepID=UPI001BCEDDD0|nr:Hsp70 family protein [Micromonospora sp. NBRC 107566]
MAAALVVDLGAACARAAVFDSGDAWLVPDPADGSGQWPAAAYLDPAEGLAFGALAERHRPAEPANYAGRFVRTLDSDAPVTLGDHRYRPVDLVAGLLAAIGAAARRRHGGVVDRLLLTVPVSYTGADPRREWLIAAGEAAGFGVVELLAEPLAAAHAPGSGPALPSGSRLLVYGLGASGFSTALVELDRHGHRVLAQAGIDGLGGDPLDALIAEHIRASAQPWRETALTGASAADATRLDRAVTDLARQVREGLSDGPVVERSLLPDTPPYRLTADEFAALAEPLLRRTVECAEQVLAEAGAAPDEVLPVGGATRMPLVTRLLAGAFHRPVRRFPEPELAVVRGAVGWLPRSGPRVIAAETPGGRTVPLAFPIPGGGGTLVRWLVEPGEPYGAGHPLARVRLPGGALWDLVAAAPGAVDRFLVGPGTPVAAGEWLAVVRA